MSSQPPDYRPGRSGGPPRSGRPGGPGGVGGPGSPGPEQSWRWGVLILLGLVVVAFALTTFLRGTPSTKINYNTYLSDLSSKSVSTASVNNSTGQITGSLRNGTAYTVSGPAPITNAESSALTASKADVNYNTPSSNSFVSDLIFYGIIVIVIIAIFWYMSRRAQGQMTGIMSIGRSKAKMFSTDRPRTTFDDVAGYSSVKQEISEVVEFLKTPGRFKDIGARIPKGVLLVGPPGTGKTLLARAVAGEAGVPFMSVSGSDFMEMFVGVGASRVRDMFQTARKQAPAIIFVDEIDSIGRKRGAGLGGGHDEREQTLNQMLSEMDGFETTEGIVMMAATNRPDILDPALLRPGRFDRQIVVPLPDLDERLPILVVHCKDKRMSPDVDLETVARGTPGMSGADLANLVNEAALHAVRRASDHVEMQDFEAARDRILMGQRRESLVLSDDEKERVAYHEGGHAVLAYVLDNADPVHKVTILPTGMALGVTQQLPLEERHIYPIEYIEDSLAVRMGGRAAEMLIYNNLSTGAANDLVGNTELARKMVREFGMSSRIGPMAWGSQGMVFLGEDLMHSRDYSEDTSRVIDEEVEKILREQEDRATEYLTRHKSGLEAVAMALLERETVEGAEVARLVDEAYGKPVHPDGDRRKPHRFLLIGGPGEEGIEAPPEVGVPLSPRGYQGYANGSNGSGGDSAGRERDANGSNGSGRDSAGRERDANGSNGSGGDSAGRERDANGSTNDPGPYGTPTSPGDPSDT